MYISEDETTTQSCIPTPLGSEVLIESPDRVKTLAGTEAISGEPL